MKNEKLNKLSLEQFTVKSFTTSLTNIDVDTIKGGCPISALSDCTRDSGMSTCHGSDPAFCRVLSQINCTIVL